MSYFETRKRDNGETYTTCKDDAPKWVRDAVYAAHDGMLPNDWVYAECAAAFEACESGELGGDNEIHPYADGRVDVYTSALYEWAAQFCNSSLYADAEEEAGEFLNNAASMSERLMAIQYAAIGRIAQTVVDAWEENHEEEEVLS